jgi:hypothetical protein
MITDGSYFLPIIVLILRTSRNAYPANKVRKKKIKMALKLIIPLFAGQDV